MPKVIARYSPSSPCLFKISLAGWPSAFQMRAASMPPVKYEAPKGIKLSAPQPTSIVIEGANNEIVGQVAAELRSLRPPEPYKGKGIKYVGEQVRRKAGKAGKAGAK